MSVYPKTSELMEGQLGQWLKGQTQLREEAKRAADNRLFRVALFGLPALAFLWILLPLELKPKIFATAVACALAWRWSQGPKRKAVQRVKSGINDAIAQALGLTYECDMQAGYGFERARTYRMLPSYDRSSFEDCWSGEYDGHDFVLHEAHLEERRGSGKRRRWVTTFKGAIIVVGLARSAYGTTLVQRSGRNSALFGGVKDEIAIEGKVLGYVDMVHPEFEDAFEVFSTDQVEARYLVHPEYVERLIDIERAFDGNGVCCLFDGGELVIVVDSGDMFESGSIESADDRQRIETTIEQFATLAGLASTLNEPGARHNEFSSAGFESLHRRIP